ncbi:MAG: type II toxin-antitoxin system VapC family toxin [Candidatus Hatepunaea meridiana]|nr:type II toxin-antitoxin system VapC family toxin [Candidatus Hatepunaea meridiana]
MIALDTNILIRYITRDNEEQAQQVDTLVERTIENNDELFVSDITLCEIVWVLKSGYRRSRQEIVRVLWSLYRSTHLAFISMENYLSALEAYETGKGDFADYLIREYAYSVGCDTVVTFDKKLLTASGFRLP